MPSLICCTLTSSYKCHLSQQTSPFSWVAHTTHRGLAVWVSMVRCNGSLLVPCPLREFSFLGLFLAGLTLGLTLLKRN
jgi:hypothetical protein